MPKTLVSTFVKAPKWSTIRFDGLIERKDIDELFMYKRTESISVQTFESAERGKSGHIAFIANSHKDAVRIYNSLKPVLEQRGYELVSRI